MRKLLTLLTAAALGALGISLAATVSPSKADNGSPKTGQVYICHHTGNSQAHEWVYIHPDASGVLDGHGKVIHQDQEDIIPAFSFVDAHGVTHSFAGQNLTTPYDASLEPTVGGSFTGAEILANKCKVPPPPTTSTSTTPTTTATTPTTTATVPTTTSTQTVTNITTVSGGTVTTPTQTVSGGTVTSPTQTVSGGTVTTPTQTVQGKPKVIHKTVVTIRHETRTVTTIIKKPALPKHPKSGYTR